MSNGKIKSFFARHGQLIFSLAIIAVGIVLAVVFIKFRKPPQRITPERLAPLVRTIEVVPGPVDITVMGFGTVSAKTRVEVVPQVSGKVVWRNPDLRPGRIIDANEVLFRIDPLDYELTVKQAQAAVAEAKVRLDLERAESEVVKNEWEQLNPGQEPDSPLVLRVPQVQQAQAALASAKARLEEAELALQRTSVSLPLDALIISERIDIGQFVTSGQMAAEAYGVESVEIEVPLEDNELAWINIPNQRSSLNKLQPDGSQADIVANFAGGRYTWEGFVTRTTGRVDPASRMVSVVVEVPQPFANSDKPALLPGTFVAVRIKGGTLEHAAVVPRDAVRGQNRLWVVNDGILHIEEIEIARSDDENVYVSEGIERPTKVIVSSLDIVADGMQVRTQASESE